LPILFERHDSRRTLLATAEGPVTADDILTFISTQSEIGSWRWRVLFDSRTIDLSTITDESVQQIAAHIERVAEGRRRGPMAIVADVERAARISQIYVAICAQVAGLVIGVFHDQENAESWLARIPLED
jgi:hypothetical protein